MSSLFFLVFGFSLIGPLLAGLVSIFGKNSLTMNRLAQELFALSGACGFFAAVLSFFAILGKESAPIEATWLGIQALHIVLDGWSAFFLAVINAGVFIASMYAMGYLPRYASAYSFPSLNFASALFIFGMQATVLSSTMLGFLFFWEVMSLSAYFLVIADREEASLKAGLLYLIMTNIGAACLFIGLFVLAQGNVDATFAMLATSAAHLPVSSLGIAFFFLLAGFGSKAGLVPLHQWLPYAHPQAPSHSSALMSGVMLKVALYGFLRLVVNLFPDVPLVWSSVVVVVGLLSALFGVLHAAVEPDLKRLLAWSSIENMGIIFTSLGLSMVFRHLGLPSWPLIVIALVHALNHFVFKTGLFLSAGSIISETHTRDLNHLGGLARAWPWFSGWFLGLVFAAAALPPFGTFYAEWMVFQHVASQVGHVTVPVATAFIFVIAILALVGGLAIFTFANVFSAVFLSRPRTEHAAHVHALPSSLVWPIALCATVGGLLGLVASPLMQVIGRLVGQPLALNVIGPIEISSGSIPPIWLVLATIVIGVLVILARRIAMSQKVRITGTWDCGQPITPRMEYTPTGFVAPIRFFFRSVLMAHHTMHAERVTPGNPWILSRRLEWKTHSLWEEWLYRPFAAAVLRASHATKKLQSGVVQFYLLLMFIALIVVLIVAV